MNRDKIYAFVNIGAYQQEKYPEKKICAITAGNNFTSINITYHLSGGQMPLSIAGMNP